MTSFISKYTDDEKIVEGLLSGGPGRKYFEKELYQKYFYFISQGVKNYRLQTDEVASAYSDTIIILIDSVVNAKFEGRSSLKSYAYQIFCNKCIDFVRKISTFKTMVNRTSDIESLAAVLPDKTSSAIQGLINKNQRSLLIQKLNETGEKCKGILLLFEDGYSDKEIAVMMEYNSADVVKTSRLRCLEKLKQKVLESIRHE